MVISPLLFAFLAAIPIAAAIIWIVYFFVEKGARRDRDRWEDSPFHIHDIDLSEGDVLYQIETLDGSVKYVKRSPEKPTFYR